MSRKGKICCIADQFCLSPAGYKVGNRCGTNNMLARSLPKCVSCGNDVCRNCSYIKNQKRYCAYCLEHEFGASAELTILTRMYRLAGYTNPRQAARFHLNWDGINNWNNTNKQA